MDASGLYTDGPNSLTPALLGSWLYRLYDLWRGNSLSLAVLTGFSEVLTELKTNQTGKRKLSVNPWIT